MRIPNLRMLCIFLQNLTMYKSENEKHFIFFLINVREIIGKSLYSQNFFEKEG